VVATPIGNLDDITLRALTVLRSCDTVLCEDTRVTRKLLTHYEIDTPTLSFHEHSGDIKYDKVLELLRDGAHLALVSDAGTPTVSDPGAGLVARVRSDLPDVCIEVIPGPSALVAALSIAGVPADSFTFLGFPPHKKGRQTFFDTLAARTDGLPTIFYESPHRLVKALEALHARLTDHDQVTVCRELTKLHEEVVQGTAACVLDHFLAHPDTVRGECVVIVRLGAVAA